MALMTDSRPFVHDPVLLDRVLELLAPVPAGTVVDATLGGAGHATAVLQSRPDLRVLGLDRDRHALDAAQARLAPYGDRAEAHHARFDQLATVVAAAGAASQPIVGVLFDLGVSSPQLDDADRGFSYRHDAPLDQRMHTSTGQTAAEVVKELDALDLAAVLRRNADERFAARIARAIVAARPLATNPAAPRANENNTHNVKPGAAMPLLLSRNIPAGGTILRKKDRRSTRNARRRPFRRPRTDTCHQPMGEIRGSRCRRRSMPRTHPDKPWYPRPPRCPPGPRPGSASPPLRP